jgi:hypothetical protein
MDVAVVGHIVAVVGHGAGVDRADPEQVDAQVGQVIQPLDDAGQVADAVAVAVLEAARIDFVDDGVVPPFQGRCRADLIDLR